MASSKLPGSRKRTLKSYDSSSNHPTTRDSVANKQHDLELEQRCKDHIMSFGLSDQEDLPDAESFLGVDWLKEEAPWPLYVQCRAHQYMHEKNLYQVSNPDDPIFVGLVDLVKSQAGVPNTRNWEQKVPDKCRSLINTSTRTWKQDGLLVTHNNLAWKSEVFQYLWDCAIHVRQTGWSAVNTDSRKRSTGSMQQPGPSSSAKRARRERSDLRADLEEDSIDFDYDTSSISSSARDFAGELTRHTTAVSTGSTSAGLHKDGNFSAKSVNCLDSTVMTAREALSAVDLAENGMRSPQEGIQLSQKTMGLDFASEPNRDITPGWCSTHENLRTNVSSGSPSHSSPGSSVRPAATVSDLAQAASLKPTVGVNTSQNDSPSRESLLSTLQTADRDAMDTSLNPIVNNGLAISPSNPQQKENSFAKSNSISRTVNPSPDHAPETNQAERRYYSLTAQIVAQGSQTLSPPNHKPLLIDDGVQSNPSDQSGKVIPSPGDSDVISEERYSATSSENSASSNDLEGVIDAPQVSANPQNSSQNNGDSRQATAQQPPLSGRTDQDRETASTTVGTSGPPPPNPQYRPSISYFSQKSPPPPIPSQYQRQPTQVPAQLASFQNSQPRPQPPPPPSTFQTPWPNGPPPIPAKYQMQPTLVLAPLASNHNRSRPPPPPPPPPPTSVQNQWSNGPPPPPQPPPPPSTSHNPWPNSPPPIPAKYQMHPTLVSALFSSNRNQSQLPPPPPPPPTSLQNQRPNGPPPPPPSYRNQGPPPPPTSYQNQGPPPPPPPYRNQGPPPPPTSPQNQRPNGPPPPPTSPQDQRPNGPPPPPASPQNQRPDGPPPPPSHPSYQSQGPPPPPPYPVPTPNRSYSGPPPSHIATQSEGSSSRPQQPPPSLNPQYQMPPAPPPQPLSSINTQHQTAFAPRPPLPSPSTQYHDPPASPAQCPISPSHSSASTQYQSRNPANASDSVLESPPLQLPSLGRQQQPPPSPRNSLQHIGHPPPPPSQNPPVSTPLDSSGSASAIAFPNSRPAIAGQPPWETTEIVWKKLNEMVKIHVPISVQTDANLINSGRVTSVSSVGTIFKQTIAEFFQWVSNISKTILPSQLVLEFMNIHSELLNRMTLHQGDAMILEAVKATTWEYFRRIANLDPAAASMKILIIPYFSAASGSVGENMHQKSQQLHQPSYAPLPNQIGSRIASDSASSPSAFKPRGPTSIGPPQQSQSSLSRSLTPDGISPHRGRSNPAPSPMTIPGKKNMPEENIPDSDDPLVAAHATSNQNPQRQPRQQATGIQTPNTKIDNSTPSTAKIVIRIQIDGHGRLSRSYDKSVLNTRITVERFFAWFEHETGGCTCSGRLKFDFKDALPAKSSVITRGNDDHFDLMVHDIKRKFERAKEYAPDMNEFCIVVTDPDWDSSDEDGDE